MFKLSKCPYTDGRHYNVVKYHMTFHIAPLWLVPWWGQQMKTFSALLALYVGNSPVTGEFLSQRPVTRIFDVFLWSAPEQRVEETIEMPVIWDVIAHHDVTVMYCTNRSSYSQNNPLPLPKRGPIVTVFYIAEIRRPFGIVSFDHLKWFSHA